MTGAPRLVSGTRGQRYGEVLLVRLGGVSSVEVYNSYLLNECPEELWNALDEAALAREHHATLALLNGPRYWMMDGIGKVDVVEPVVSNFGGIAMRLVATLELEGGLERAAYRERHVNRGASWHFDAGRPIYELTTPEGSTYVLQAYCTAVEPSLGIDTIPSLAARLRLPDGWRFSERVLEDELVVDTTQRTAVVLQDELQNTYTLVS